MIKILLPNANKGRNKASYAPFIRFKEVFRQIGVEFRTYGRCDFAFAGNEEFQDRKLSLEDSINYGIDNINKLRMPVYLIDSSDSTSIVGSYEVLQNSIAKVLVKNQLLEREQYAKPSQLGRWWIPDENGHSYKIPVLTYSNHMKLSGWNLGYHDPRYDQFIYPTTPRDIDICSIFQHTHDENYEWKIRNDVPYTEHRNLALSQLSNVNHSIVGGKLSYNDYIDVLQRSKVGLSPFGMGEICFRDFELMRFGVVMIKPYMDKVQTKPSLYIPWKTYVPVKPDWSDLPEVLDVVLGDWDKYKGIADNMRMLYRNMYSVSYFIRHWHNLLSNEANITI